MVLVAIRVLLGLVAALLLLLLLSFSSAVSTLYYITPSTRSSLVVRQSTIS